jgi:hypothetical protein
VLKDEFFSSRWEAVVKVGVAVVTGHVLGFFVWLVHRVRTYI